ncbi:chemosensory pili system protein ChpC [Microbulbifer donghaiensis]|uniref:Chemosensory pili system protein ChpC n=1 Tax=Microbulbifer donghaiensis TaxID=494016 RepID=A0A1M5EKC5_9GAMM|nr:chemotaxis protein CheW [Microbulbifer donghaiensis]SHF79616.1 chemosensory pili system protein ChpC [Microbulbifer donghaiensis]
MSGLEALPVDVPREVSSLLLPLADGQLLVPVDTLSEVIAIQTPVAAYDAPPWYLGELNWREQRLPLLSYEVMRGQPLTVTSESGRIAVLSSGNPQGDLPFFALVLQGTPRLVRVTPDELSERSQACQQGELMHVALSGEEAVIPDLSELERACLEYRSQR